VEVYHAMAVHSDHETPRWQSDKEVGTPNEPKKYHDRDIQRRMDYRDRQGNS